MTAKLTGLVAAAHTPFHEDGSLAPEIVGRQAAYLQSQGIRSVFITGSTGEAHSLTREERLRIFEAWASVREENELQVIAHVGSNCLEDSRAFARAAGELELDGFSALAPSYYKPGSPENLVDCCAFIAAEAPEIPFYYYDIPVLTGVCFDMAAFLPLAADRIPNFAGIKYTNADLDGYERCLQLGDFDLPWGIDEKILEALQRGATGAVGSSYNFAAPLYHELIEAFKQGDTSRAETLQAQAVELIETLAGYGYLAAAKALLGWQGVPVGPARLPLENPTSDQLEKLKARLSPNLLTT